jgi:hypothetical protein
MYAHHWVMLGVVLIAGYLLGAQYPSLAKTVGIGAAS